MTSQRFTPDMYLNASLRGRFFRRENEVNFIYEVKGIDDRGTIVCDCHTAEKGRYGNLRDQKLYLQDFVTEKLIEATLDEIHTIKSGLELKALEEKV